MCFFLKPQLKKKITIKISNQIFFRLINFLLLLFSGKPEPVQNCSVVNESPDSFQVNCAPGFNGGLPQQFSLAVYKVRPDSEYILAANLTASSPSFTVSGLDPGSSYAGELIPHNVKGTGRPTRIQVYTLKLPEKLIPHIEKGPAPGQFVNALDNLFLVFVSSEGTNGLYKMLI